MMDTLKIECSNGNTMGSDCREDSDHGRSFCDMTEATELNSSLQHSDATDRSRTASCSSGVSFGSVHVREYDRSLGDLLEVSYGLAIGWEYEEQDPVPIGPLEEIDVAEKSNKFQKMMRKLGFKPKPKPRRRKPVRVDAFTGQPINPIRREKRFDRSPTSISQRVMILHKFGFSTEDLVKAEKQRSQANFERYLAMD
jgi:hypothetical protein